MLTPQQLEDYLDVLVDKGVTSFSCPDFCVAIGPQPVELEDDIGTAIKSAAAIERMPSVARGNFGHPSLWPNGRPPTFPGSERSTAQHKPTHPDDTE